MRFKQFLAEMPLLVKGNEDIRKSDRPLNHTAYLHPKISEFHNYDVHDVNGQNYSFVDRHTKHTHLTICGRHEEGGREFHVDFVRGSHQFPHKAHEAYAHLIRHHGLTLYSDNKQTKGGANIWQGLSKHYPDIHVRQHDSIYGKEFPINHGDWSKNYGTESRFSATARH